MNSAAPLRAIGISAVRDLEAERAVLGAALISDRVVEPVCTETGLRPEHFSSSDHGNVWRAIQDIVDRGDRVDLLVLHRQLNGAWGTDMLEELAADVPSVTNAKAYARRVVEASQLEHRRTAHIAALIAIADRDERALEVAEADAAKVVGKAAGHLTNPAALADEMARIFSEPVTPGLPLPWPTLAKRLRLRAGASTVLAGWTSMGKSHVAGALADHVGEAGQHAVIWTNEMSREEITARRVQRITGVPSDQVLDRDVPPDRGSDVLEAIRKMPFGIVEADGWSAGEIARHIRHVKPALAVVDHFHAIPGTSRTADADDAVIALTSAARQAGMHVLIVCQLNHGRDATLLRPPPTMRDLRGTGALQSLPNNVLLFHRDEEELQDDGRPLGRAVTTENGILHVAKQRGGRKDVFVNVRFDEKFITVLERGWL